MILMKRLDLMLFVAVTEVGKFVLLVLSQLTICGYVIVTIPPKWVDLFHRLGLQLTICGYIIVTNGH